MDSFKTKKRRACDWSFWVRRWKRSIANWDADDADTPEDEFDNDSEDAEDTFTAREDEDGDADEDAGNEDGHDAEDEGVDDGEE